ncbi:hypothetical protein AB6A40_008407 [Gnathostoma spinigerum]|uniref:Chromo domain-containing protein n=1 Tax=Gnathostoma spinigerum TaxID=75299 RepID=A0ABD6EP12_9BILA
MQFRAVEDLGECCGEPDEPLPTAESGNGEEGEEYSVEKILGERYNAQKRCKEYLIKWEGYGDEENTWEPECNLDCPEILEEFRQSLRSTSRSSQSSVKKRTKAKRKAEQSSTDEKVVESEKGIDGIKTKVEFASDSSDDEESIAARRNPKPGESGVEKGWKIESVQTIFPPDDEIPCLTFVVKYYGHRKLERVRKDVMRKYGALPAIEFFERHSSLNPKSL